MRSPVEFKVIMVSGMIIASAFLSFQLDKIYAQAQDTFISDGIIEITASVPPCTIDLNEDELPDELDCAESDNGATATGLVPSNQELSFDEFSLDCEIHIEDDDEIPPDQNPAETGSLAYYCNLISSNDWKAEVTCIPSQDPLTTGTNHLQRCNGQVFFEVPPEQVEE